MARAVSVFITIDDDDPKLAQTFKDIPEGGTKEFNIVLELAPGYRDISIIVKDGDMIFHSQRMEYFVEIPTPTNTPTPTPLPTPTSVPTSTPTPGPTLTPTPTFTPSAVQEDRATLIAIYKATGGNWDHARNWLSSEPIGEWRGVTVNDSGRVVKLELSSRDMLSEIPPRFGDLDELRYLDLEYSELFGKIPPELGNLKNLQYLSLQGNNLSGRIPPELGNLTKLTNLNLKFNNLSGDIPAELGNIPNLQVLYLDAVRSQLVGCIPSNLRRVPVTDLDDLRLPYCEDSTRATQSDAGHTNARHYSRATIHTHGNSLATSHIYTIPNSDSYTDICQLPNLQSCHACPHTAPRRHDLRGI